jgi:hypothetical protein
MTRHDLLQRNQLRNAKIRREYFEKHRIVKRTDEFFKNYFRRVKETIKEDTENIARVQFELNEIN